MTFVGYAEGRKAYRFLHPNGDWVVISRDAKFLEMNDGQGAVQIKNNVSLNEAVQPTNNRTETFDVSIGSSEKCVRDNTTEPPQDDDEITETTSDSASADNGGRDSSDLDFSVFENATEGDSPFAGFPLDDIARRSKRFTKGVPPRRLINETLVAAAMNDEVEPTCLQEALQCDQSMA
ncbi:uncharacterized protein LOC131427095 [Malaya genurostris]|uniref:uncharacterized protein LOC131427095 n=1 Tax=Malaya genurostris TaxID=325434 RepID=UPI0026F3E19E|nr:uncharacterized protein LOC131427095 [Malaya genurostris]